MKYNVECHQCDHQFMVDQQEIAIDLEDSYDGFNHDYWTDCPQCERYVTVDILDQHPCCFPSGSLRYEEVSKYNIDWS